MDEWKRDVCGCGKSASGFSDGRVIQIFGKLIDKVHKTTMYQTHSNRQLTVSQTLLWVTSI